MQSWRSNLNRRFEGLLHWRLLGEESNFVWFISLNAGGKLILFFVAVWPWIHLSACLCVQTLPWSCIGQWLFFLHIVFQGGNSWPSLGLTYGWSLWCSSGSTIFSFVCLFKAPVISLLWIACSCSSMCFEWIKVSLALMSLCSCFPVIPVIPGRSTHLTLSSWPILAGNPWPRTLLSHLPTCPPTVQTL